LSKLFFPLSTALAVIAAVSTGCEPPPPPLPANLATVAAQPAPVVTPSSQPVDIVATLSTMNITRGDLDQLLYETYGLRMLFDLVERDLAKNTLEAAHIKIEPKDFVAERKIFMDNIRGDNKETDDENLFEQLLQREHLTRAEFDVKVIQTGAYLRKLAASKVVGSISEAVLHRGFEMMYGEKRQIADIELNNVREAQTAAARIKTEEFGIVASDMSIDQQARPFGGKWAPFSANTQWIPQVIINAAFSMQKGQCSDILEDGGKFHIIKLIDIKEPTIVKYEDVKENVRKELEGRLIEIAMKQMREQLTLKAQQMHFVDPILKAQWNELVAKQNATTDHQSALKKLNENTIHPATEPASTQP
jgi:parvulin-like peptidyl-prolyl isomerase